MAHTLRAFTFLLPFAMLRLLSLIVLVAMPLSALAIEEPEHEVVRRIGDIEIRQYASYVVAEVTVPGPADTAGSEAFPILAGYIFGKNKGDRKLQMTSPVTQSPVPMKLAMTAPVTQSPAPDGYVVQFVLPKDVTLSTAPEPLDPRIRLREVAPATWAVIRYSGFWSASNYDEHLAELKLALAAARVEWSGAPVLSRYDPPFTPWFLRRNEIWLAVR